MRQFLTTLLLTSFTLITQTAFADGLLYELPEDGAFVLYDLDIVRNRGDQKMTTNGTFKLSSVGTVTVNGKKCRWIEIKMIWEMIGDDHVVIGKLLVPEENLKAGENAFGNKIRGWVRMSPKAKVRSINEKNSGMMSAFLCGPLSREKKRKPVMVESKLGKFECAGVSGFTKYQYFGIDNKVTFETRLHKKAPFGIVSTVLIMESAHNGQYLQKTKMTFTLKEVGKNAKSELPDAK